VKELNVQGVGASSNTNILEQGTHPHTYSPSRHSSDIKVNTARDNCITISGRSAISGAMRRCAHNG